MVGKPNLVKDFCPRLPWYLDFVLGLGQAFQNILIFKKEIRVFLNKYIFFKDRFIHGDPLEKTFVKSTTLTVFTEQSLDYSKV